MSSIFARALSGAGAAVASLASRYIDEEMAVNKARALADIDFENMKRKDDYEQSPERQARLRENARQTTLAAGSAARENELAGLNDANLQTAREGQKDREAAADTRRKIDSRKTEIKDLLPDEIAAKNATLAGTADAEAAAAGKKKRAEQENTAYDLSPGQERYIGGQRVAANSRATPQEVQRDLYNAGLKGGGKGKSNYERMDESEKLTYQELIKSAQKADDEVSKFASAGQPMTDKDGKPTENYAFLQKQRATAMRNLTSFKMQRGLIDPEDAATAAVSGERDASKIGQAIAEAFALGGSDFGDKFYAKVRASGVLENLADDRAAAQSAKPASKASSRPEQPAYEPPPDSPSGKWQARQRSIKEQAQAQQERGRADAQAALAAIGNDPSKAADLQSSRLFAFLTHDEKAQVQRLVMGR